MNVVAQKVASYGLFFFFLLGAACLSRVVSGRLVLPYAGINPQPGLTVLPLPLQVVLCLSPMGTSLRVRALRFPGLVQCTTMDWFHPWTREALQSVSYRFLQEIEGIEVWPLELLNDSCRLFYMILQFVCGGRIQRFSVTAERQQGCRVLSSPDHVRL